MVSGTNGKTTTASMLRAILRSERLAFAANHSGANLRSGVATALLDAPRDAGFGVFEVDEAALPRLVDDLRPRLLVLTNVFRDQLDRFAEPERVAELLAQAARSLPSGSVIVANADDPQLWHAVEDLEPVGFGVITDAESAAGPDAGGTGAEPETCPACGAPLEFSRRTMANLGAARCGRCAWRSPAVPYRARLVSRAGAEAQVLLIRDELLTLPLGGLHDAYNAAAAIAAADLLGIPVYRSVSALEAFEPRFGRAEELDFGEARLWLGLVKNPAGAAAVIGEVAVDRRVGAAVLAVSDRDADGRDVSWIWDADVERLVGRGIPMVPSGSRAADVAVRLKYAGAHVLPAEADLEAALDAAAAACPPGRLVAVLATYTAMLDVRKAVLGTRAGRVMDGPA